MTFGSRRGFGEESRGEGLAGGGGDLGWEGGQAAAAMDDMDLLDGTQFGAGAGLLGESQRLFDRTQQRRVRPVTQLPKPLAQDLAAQNVGGPDARNRCPDQATPG